MGFKLTEDQIRNLIEAIPKEAIGQIHILREHDSESNTYTLIIGGCKESVQSTSNLIEGTYPMFGEIDRIETR